jgi:metal-responsive CopG/Arc/MetJ family transcriptional regulator
MVGRTQQKQVNIRLDDETISALDACRAEQRNPHGNIPTRSDIVREAIDEYLLGRGKKSADQAEHDS